MGKAILAGSSIPSSSQNIIQASTATDIATVAKVAVTAAGNYSPVIGDMIALTLTNGNNVASATLKIDSSSAIAIMMNGAAINTTAGTLSAGAVLILYYDGTYYQMMGSQRTSDSDTYNRMSWNNTITAGAAIYDYKMLMQAADGKFYPLTLENGTGTTKTVSTQEFLINSPILHYYSSTDVAANGTTTSVYSEIATTALDYTINQASWTSQLPFYLKCVLQANGTIKLDNTSYTSFVTQALPTTEDGYLYILFGYAYSTSGFRLFQNHPIYEYKNGRVRQYAAMIEGTDYCGIDANNSGKINPARSCSTVYTIAVDTTLSLAHAGCLLRCTSSTATIITIPLLSVVAFPLGTEIEILRMGTGAVTITPASGITLYSSSGSSYSTSARSIDGRITSVCLKRYGTDLWLLQGALAI